MYMYMPRIRLLPGEDFISTKRLLLSAVGECSHDEPMPISPMLTPDLTCFTTAAIKKSAELAKLAELTELAEFEEYAMSHHWRRSLHSLQISHRLMSFCTTLPVPSFPFLVPDAKKAG